MVHVLVLTHGELAKNLYETLGLFIDDQTNIEAICLGEDPEKMRNSLQKRLMETEVSEFLLLVDLFGGTPFNISASLLPESSESGKKVEIITGVNLPMLVSVAFEMEGKGLSELKCIAIQNGKEGVRDFMEEIKKQK